MAFDLSPKGEQDASGQTCIVDSETEQWQEQKGETEKFTMCLGSSNVPTAAETLGHTVKNSKK